MANSRSARKRIRSSERKHVRNRAVKSAVRTKVIKARHALLEEGAATGEAELHAAIKALDRAAEKGILHRNNVRRRKSRLASMAARLANVAEGTEGAAARSAAAGGAKGRSAKQQTRATAAKTAVKPAGKAPAPKASAVKATPAKAATPKAAAPKASTPKAAAPAKSPAKAPKTK